MEDDDLFGNLPEVLGPQRTGKGRPRLRAPVRDQIELRSFDLDSLLPDDHPARIFWAYVEGLDLSFLYGLIKSREGSRGHPATDPRLLLALWLFATSQGVGSARALAKLCSSHDAYRWLCGGVSVNYHGLSDFRTAHPELWSRLLTDNVAALLSAGLIDLDQLAQDGLRVRAAAGSGSFRRRGKLEQKLAEAKALVELLDKELTDDADASNKRIVAAKKRAAREKQARAQQALERMAELEKQREQREKTHKKDTGKQKAPRSSTTDPQARVMKMADGGYRPAYNVQLCCVADHQIIVGVDIDTTGSDRGLIRPMLEQIHGRYGKKPRRYLADGGFTKNGDLDWAFDPRNGGTEIYAPPANNKHGSDPFAPRKADAAGVAAWRERMASEAGKTIYRQRVEVECVNARARQWNIHQFLVRGSRKASCIAYLFALANNILQGRRLELMAT